MDNFYVNLGRKLRELRSIRNLSLDDVSHMSGITKSSLSRYEKGAINLSVVKLAKLSLIYEFNIRDFISDASIYLEEVPNDSQENEG